MPSEHSVSLEPLGRDTHLTVIRPSRPWYSLGLRDLWEYRDLLYFLVWRDVKVRYKQTLIGVGWAVLQPVMTMIVFTVIFGRFAHIPSDGLPYALFSYTGLLPWQLFAFALNESSNSLVMNQQLITRVYFPRLLVPIAAVLAGLVDVACACAFLLVLLLVGGIIPGPQLAALPFIVLLCLGTALAVGLWLSALNVRFRDVRYVIPFLTQCWLFATPIVYPASMVPEQFRLIYGLNPMAGVVEAFRWSVLGRSPFPAGLLAVGAGMAFFLLFSGLIYFRRVERSFADVI